MGQSNIEFLFKITAPARERGAGALRSHEALLGFNEHLAALEPPGAPTAATTRSSTNSLPYDREYAAQLERRRANPDDQPPLETADDNSSAPTSSDDRGSRPAEEAVSSDAGESASEPVPSSDDPSGDLDAQQSDSEHEDTDATEVPNAVAVAAALDSGPLLAADEAAEAGLVAEEAPGNAGNGSTQAAMARPQNAHDGPAASLNSDHAAAMPEDAAAQGDALSAAGENIGVPSNDVTAEKTSGRAARAKKSEQELQNANAAEKLSDAGDKARSGRQQEKLIAVSTKLDGPASPDRPRRPQRSRARGEDAATDGATTATANKTHVMAVNALQFVVSGDAVKPDGEGGSDAKAASSNAAFKGDALALTAGKTPRSHAGARHATGAADSNNLPRVDAVRFVGRVAKAVQTAHERGGSLQLRLSPPELGSVRLELSVKDGVMTASLETETASARRVLLDHLPALRDRLAEQNIRIERFDVEVQRDSGGAQGDPRASQQQQQQQQPSEQHDSRRPLPPRESAAGAPRPSAPAAAMRTNAQGINLVA